MNIKEATEQIEGAVRAYLSRDVHGLYRIPFEMQRPIIMFGPPGVGKTAIVAQIADRMGINFVSYSITHHTRQSALGLPFISKRTYRGHEYDISEYTMSEIISAAYDASEASGVDEGILFLDEVNCVSETLAPAMLQFLQFKTFGTHRLPEGWVIVTACNPPEYNRSAREFDPATLDRMKRIDVEPNLQVWQEFAIAHGVHPAVITYLDSKPSAFYKVRAGVKGSRLVTARGWDDLSRMMGAYEAEGLYVDEKLVAQYLQDDEISQDFALYYELFRKYRDDYKVADIMAGQADEVVRQRAADAPFDERIALVGLLLDAVLERVHSAVELESALLLTRKNLMDMRPALSKSSDPAGIVSQCADAVSHAPDVTKAQQQVAGDKRVVKAEHLKALGKIQAAVAGASMNGQSAFEAAKQAFNGECARQSDVANHAVSCVDECFRFFDDVYGEGQETLIFATKLSSDPLLTRLVSVHRSQEYAKHSKDLLFTQRGDELLAEIEALEE